MFKTVVAAASVAVMAILLVQGAPVSQAQTGSVHPVSPKVRAGQAQFEKVCMQCHATVEGQVSFGPNLHGVLKGPHPRKPVPEIRLQIKNGKGKMPGFGDKVTAPEMDNLIDYMKTL